MRVAVADMGTNSTRLLVADVEDGEVKELERRSTVTRLGRGVDTSRQLATEAIEDVVSAVGEYIKLYEPLEPDVVLALATSAVRDAENSGAFIAELRERFALNARILTGEEEARLTYVGAVAGRAPSDGTLVIDIGGGSTEIVVGSGREMAFHTSLQLGTVRHTERHIRNDPPTAPELEALAEDIRKQLFAELAAADFFEIHTGIAVAGTPTSLAAIDQELDPYDPERVHGYVLSLDAIQHMYSMLSGKSLEERLKVPGLHPGRAPTIVAGVVILIQAMRAFGLQEIEVSEHDILYGAALEAAGSP
ncbi:MAG TPA: Ppx/GppA phosphatase family protein [Solirubrobacterales bacterium]|nr:Ppx/GppA phosphatase family protein [Solirubrobacterales bacterium]